MSYRRLAILSGVLAAFPLTHPALAQINCGRATTPVDKAICASPQLLTQDTALVEAYRQALARMPGQSAEIREAQLRWLTERRRECGGNSGAALEACLSQAFTARIAALSPPAPPPQAQAPQAQAPQAQSPSAGAPRAAAPGGTSPEISKSATANPGTAAPPRPQAVAPVAPLPAPAWPTAVATAPAALPPGPAVTAPAARLQRAALPSAGQGETLLEVLQPGRFAIRAESPTGTALQLVDMLTGPGDESGAPDAADGRLDVLLDTGTYKLRTQGAENAQGETRLTVTPFAEAAPPAILRSGESFSAALADTQQRAFWFVVEKQRPVRIEAAGRALRDLRLWREGRDLVPTRSEAGTIEPTSGHTLNRLVMTAELEPGTYLVTAYGGPSLPWADGAPATPFHLRLDGAPTLAQGWLSGVIGPFGSEVFELPSQANRFRLTLPEPAAARLDVVTGARTASAVILPERRDPVAQLNTSPRGEAPRRVTVTGREGQAFQLRAFGGEAIRRQPGPGTYLVAAEAVGLGGDGVPATVLLRRDQSGREPVLLGGSGPRVAPGQAWRSRFNLRGAVTLLVQVTAPGPIAVRAEGVAVNATIQPVTAPRAPGAANGDSQRGWDLAPGWYRLRLEPPANASGVLDLTVGPPGLIPANPAPPQPADPVLALGTITLEEGQRLSLLSNGSDLGLVARPLPLDPAAGPLTVTQLPGQALEFPLAAGAVGEPVATALGGGTAEARVVAGNPAALRLPAPQAPRTTILSWRQPAAPPVLPRPQPLPNLGTLGAGQPVFLTLGRDEQRSFALRVPEGGLYRVETLGRLRSRGQIGTAFLPELDQAEANGTGTNMLIQHYLRAGDYRLTVGAVNSAGRLGVVARPAPMQQGATLLPGTTVRAALPAGSGTAFPIEITEPGDYRLDLPSLGRGVAARLEDAEGWPLLPIGPLDGLVQTLRPGRYRLVVLPADVESRIVARLAQQRPAQALEGHGPHPLAFDAPARHQWREPAGRDDTRTPDQWDFALAGPATVTLAIDNGMAANLLRLEGESATRAGGLADGTPFTGTLPAGRYRVEARALGRNDRLDYRLSLRAEELQPETPRAVSLPASIPFAIAEDRVVSLTTFGATALRGTLRDAEGRVVARDEGQPEDWNLATSRLLPAGRYTLDLAAVTTELRDISRGYDSNNGEGEESAEDTEGPGDDTESAPADGEDSGEGQDGAAPGAITLRLALPEARAPRAVEASGTQVLENGGVHRLALPAAPDGSLVLASAQSTDTLALSLERQQPDGSWRSVSTDRGTAPLVAVPAVPGAQWRASVWSVEGGTAPVRFAARIASPAAQAPGRVAPAAVDGLPGVFLAAVDAPGSALLSVQGEGQGLRQADAPGRGLRRVEDGLLAPQAGRVWLLATRDAPLQVAVVRPAAGSATVLNLPSGDTATLPPPADAARPRLWLARQDGPAIALQAGRGMGVATGSTLALAGEAPLRVGNALSRDTARIALSLLEPALAEPRNLADAATPLLPANTAQPLRLPPGGKRLRLDLAPGTAAILGWRGADAVTIWAGDAATSRLAEGEWTEVLLVNTRDTDAPASIALATLDAPPMALRPGLPLKRFIGAAGSLMLPVAPQPNQRIAVAGATARFIGADGSMAEGARLAPSGPGWLVLEHGPGPVVAWLEGEGASPWPPGNPQPVAVPRQLRLAGDSMALSLSPPGPVLLHARTTAPVVLALGEDAPQVFPAGAELHRYLPGGPAVLRLLSPQDGPLSGSLELTATPVHPAEEGLGAPVMVGAGGSALFGFTMPREGWVGLGIRAEPDLAQVRLLDAQGAEQGRGLAQLHRLQPGRYVIEARIPADATATALRPAILGLTPRPSGPPPEIARQYRDMAGITPALAR